MSTTSLFCAGYINDNKVLSSSFLTSSILGGLTFMTMFDLANKKNIIFHEVIVFELKK